MPKSREKPRKKKLAAEKILLSDEIIAICI